MAVQTCSHAEIERDGPCRTWVCEGCGMTVTFEQLQEAGEDWRMHDMSIISKHLRHDADYKQRHHQNGNRNGQ